MHAAFCAVAEGGDCDVQVAGLFGNLMGNTVDATAASSDDAHANGICCHCWFLRGLYHGLVKNIQIIPENKSYLRFFGEWGSIAYLVGVGQSFEIVDKNQ